MRILLIVLACLTALVQTPAMAAENVHDVIVDQQQRGVRSPQAAIARLEAAGATLGADEPVELRRRYHAALSSVAISADDEPRVQASLTQLQQLADIGCEPCLKHKLIRQAQWALRRENIAEALAALQEAEPLASGTDPDIQITYHYARGVAYASSGDHLRAIEHGVRAGELAAAAEIPAEQIKAMNLIALANIGAGDLDRAEALLLETFVLAERTGSAYLMAPLRSNLGAVYSLKGEPEKQYQALTDALRIARSEPGLHEIELVHLYNLAEYHSMQKQHRLALDLAGQAVKLAEETNNPVSGAMALGLVGHTRAALGEVETGLRA